MEQVVQEDYKICFKSAEEGRRRARGELSLRAALGPQNTGGDMKDHALPELLARVIGLLRLSEKSKFQVLGQVDGVALV
eukprot:2617933-Heterocapsa_arctica.AAC.1